MIKTAIFSGSFNPIHTGHLLLASYLCQWGGMDEVWFIVSPQNPLKAKSDLLEDSHRVAMVQRAIATNPRFSYCDIEFSLPRPSYTINTLEALQERYGSERDFCLLMGADNWRIMDKWYRGMEIVERFALAVYPRLGYEVDEAQLAQHKRVRYAKAPIIEISSTFIRQGLGEGRDMAYFLPEAVSRYINEHKLYGAATTTNNRDLK